MANRTLYGIQTLGKNRVVLAGSFAPNGSNPISPNSIRGRGFTVAYTSTGLYTITLDDVWAQCDSAIATLQLATAGGKFVNIGSIDLAAKTVQIAAWDISGEAKADIAADPNNRINFVLALRNSALEN